MWVEVSEPVSELVRCRPRSLGDDALIEDHGEEEGEGVLDEEPIRNLVQREERLPVLVKLSLLPFRELQQGVKRPLARRISLLNSGGS